jgi:hypothetical protein
MKIFSQKEGARGHSVPVIVTVIVAVVGMAGILLNDLGPGNDSHNGDASMITAAAVSKAGAIEIPSGPASWG